MSYSMFEKVKVYNGSFVVVYEGTSDEVYNWLKNEFHPDSELEGATYNVFVSSLVDFFPVKAFIAMREAIERIEKKAKLAPRKATSSGDL